MNVSFKTVIRPFCIFGQLEIRWKMRNLRLSNQLFLIKKNVVDWVIETLIEVIKFDVSEVHEFQSPDPLKLNPQFDIFRLSGSKRESRKRM